MTEKIPFTESASVERVSTEAFITSSTPYIAAVKKAQTSACMMAVSLGFPPPPPPMLFPPASTLPPPPPPTLTLTFVRLEEYLALW